MFGISIQAGLIQKYTLIANNDSVDNVFLIILSAANVLLLASPLIAALIFCIRCIPVGWRGKLTSLLDADDRAPNANSESEYALTAPLADESIQPEHYHGARQVLEPLAHRADMDEHEGPMTSSFDEYLLGVDPRAMIMRPRGKSNQFGASLSSSTL
jgi:hypothetical protein